MNRADASTLPRVLDRHERELLSEWMGRLTAEGALKSGRIRETELRSQCETFLKGLRTAVAGGEVSDIGGAPFAAVRDLLDDMSRSRALQNFSPSETAIFVFSLKQPLFAQLGREHAADASRLAREVWTTTELLDRLGLYTLEAYQKSRDEVIARQQQEISELSTPVVRMWDRILTLPLIGTLDSARTQVVMENLLQEIVDAGAEIAIIDITGVPTVDTLVAQHLLKTVAATRLMGADCIISGVRPQIAQTLVHLGVELNVTSKATMADALALAFERLGYRVSRKQAD